MNIHTCFTAVTWLKLDRQEKSLKIAIAKAVYTISNPDLCRFSNPYIQAQHQLPRYFPVTFSSLKQEANFGAPPLTQLAA
jgi:hypothetical protein